MRFILVTAWRDSRASRRRLLLYATTIVLGIAGLVAVESFGANLRRTVADEPRRLLGGDIRVGLDQWPIPALPEYLSRLGVAAAREKVFASGLDWRGQTLRRGAVQVHAIDAAFPFYGNFSSSTPGAVERLRRGDPVALVDPGLADRCHLTVGDRIRLVCGTYTVAGIVGGYPGDSSLLLSLTGRVFVPWATAVPAPPKAAAPNHGNYRLYLKLPPQADAKAIAAEIKSRFATAFPFPVTADELGARISDAITAGTRFVSLVVFVGLFLGGVGVASALQVYIQERLVRVAILRCLGASAATGFGIYLVQAAALGLCGSVAGAGLGLGVQFVLPTLTRDLVPADVEIFFSWSAVLTGMAVGFSLCLAFALLPLLAVRRVPPLAALRSEAAEAPTRDPARAGVWAAILGATIAFARAETGRWGIAIGFVAALAFAFAVFGGAAAALTAAARAGLPSRMPYAARQGVANLHRPRNRTALLLLSLGLGLFAVLTVYLARSSVNQEFSDRRTPNLGLTDVSDADESGTLALAKADDLRLVAVFPAVDVVLDSVNGHPPRAPRFGVRSRVSGGQHLRASFRDRLEPYEHIVAGKFVGSVRAGTAVVPVTVAQWMSGGRDGLRVGDEAVWNVAGVPVRTRIVGIRRMQGMRLDPSFPVLFPAGAIEGAPRTDFIGLRSPSPDATARFEQDLARLHPKVGVFDIAAMVESIDRVFRRITAVVNLIAAVTVGTGLVILASAVAAGRHQRAREAAILRAIGASRAQLRGVRLAEYAAIGALAGVLGGGLAEGANALLTRLVFRIPFGGGAWQMAAAAAAVVTATVLTGVFADRGLAARPPLEILREET